MNNIEQCSPEWVAGTFGGNGCILTNHIKKTGRSNLELHEMALLLLAAVKCRHQVHLRLLCSFQDNY